MEKELELKWAAENKDKNDACLKLMRSYIPSDIKVSYTLILRFHGMLKKNQFPALSLSLFLPPPLAWVITSLRNTSQRHLPWIRAPDLNVPHSIPSSPCRCHAFTLLPTLPCLCLGVKTWCPCARRTLWQRRWRERWKARASSTRPQSASGSVVSVVLIEDYAKAPPPNGSTRGAPIASQCALLPPDVYLLEDYLRCSREGWP